MVDNTTITVEIVDAVLELSSRYDVTTTGGERRFASVAFLSRREIAQEVDAYKVRTLEMTNTRSIDEL